MTEQAKNQSIQPPWPSNERSGDRATDENTPQKDSPEVAQADTKEYYTSVAEEMLNEKQLMIFASTMTQIEQWMRSKGKDPSQLVGHSEKSVRNTIKRLDRIFRRVWNIKGTIVMELTHDICDEYNRKLAEDEIRKDNQEPYAPASKSKQNDALRKYHGWRVDERDGEPWSPRYEFSEVSNRQADYFSKEERKKLREISLDWKTIPSYSDLSPTERNEWKQYISMRLGMPIEEVEPEDWKKINCSWKIPSLIWTALDVGFRPIEVNNSSDSWLRLEKSVLYIPKSQSAKNREHWECALRPQTVEIAKRWLDERSHREKYNDTDALWLTRECNPYSSSSLNYLLRGLCEEAEINLESRNITWYSIRHSVGEHMTSEGGLQQTQEQLRHKSISSTLTYQRPSIEDRQDSLQHMG